MNENDRLHSAPTAYGREGRRFDGVGVPRAARWRSWPLPLAIAALVVAVTVTVFVIGRDGEPAAAVATPPATAEPSPSGAETTSESPSARPADAGPLAALIVHEGAAVTATGGVVKRSDGPPMMCTVYPMAATAAALSLDKPTFGSYVPVCTPLEVELEVEVQSLPGWTERDGVGFTESGVTLDGVWRDGTLVVDSATPASGDTQWPDHSGNWRVPCAPPAGGWLDGDGLAAADADLGTAEMALAAEVAAHPEVYHANWYGYPDGDPFAPDAPHGDFGLPLPEHTVMNVSTVEDPSVVRDRLVSLFPGNLCVTRVDHSGTELNAVASRLAVPDESWVLDATSLSAAVANTVFLELPVLDEAAAARIGDDAALLQVRPLVHPAA